MVSTKTNPEDELQKERNKRVEGGWTEFGITVGTVAIFMALFYMYSWQLQIIYATSEYTYKAPDGEESIKHSVAGLKYNPDEPPYCDAAACRVDGDILDIIMKFFNQTLDDIYNIIVGSVVTKLSNVVDEAKKEKEDPTKNVEGKEGDCSQGGRGKSKNNILVGGSSGKYESITDGIAVEGEGVTAGIKAVLGQSAECLPEDNTGDNIESVDTEIKKLKDQAQENSEKKYDAESKRGKVVELSNTYNKIKDLMTKANKLEDTVTKDKAPVKGAGEVDVQTEEPGKDLVKWPYRYMTTRQPPGIKNNFLRWFASTQQRSWSSGANLVRGFLLLFAPFLADADGKVTGWGFRTRLAKGEAMESIAEMKTSDDEEMKKIKVMLTAAEDKAKANPTISHENEVARLAGNLGRLAKPSFLGKWVDWFLSLGMQYNHTANHWKRFLITWFMPVIIIISLTISTFTGFWLTAFSCINKHSYFLFPILFGFVLSLINMVLQPLSMFAYMILGKGRSYGKDKPKWRGYAGRNFGDYLFINLYVGFCIIITKLGTTLDKLYTKDKDWVAAGVFGKVLSYIPIGVTAIGVLYNLSRMLYNKVKG